MRLSFLMAALLGAAPVFAATPFWMSSKTYTKGLEFKIADWLKSARAPVKLRERNRRTVSFSPDSRWVMVRNPDGRVEFFHPEEGFKVETYWPESMEEAVPVSGAAAAFSADGKFWVSFSQAARAVWRGAEASVRRLFFASKGRWILADDGSGAVRLWDARRPVPVQKWEQASIQPPPMEGRVLTVQVSEGNPFYLRSSRRGNPLRSWLGREEMRLAFFSSGSRTALASSDPAGLRFWNMESGARRSEPRDLSRWSMDYSAAFSSDGRILALDSAAGAVIRCELSRNKSPKL